MKYYTVFAGVNGAGKSTLYRTHRGLSNQERVNCDEILREFGGEWKNPEDQFKSGRIALERIDSYLEEGVSFNQETTLSSKNAIKNAMRARELGYFTELHFVHIDSVEKAIERIANRVKDGGHGISEDTVRRRYVSAVKNLVHAIDTFNLVFIYDNTVYLNNIAVFYNGELIKESSECPDWYKKITALRNGI